MEIILAIVAVILFVAIVAVVVLQKRQKNFDDEQPARIPRSARHEVPIDDAQEEIFERPVAQKPIDPLAKVEIFINEQRYDDAIAELKRILMANPKNTAAMLKLLQIYGITNNQKAFNQLHKKIHEIGDADTIKQADFCRSLLEEELDASQSTSTTTAATTQKQVAIDTLEFTTSDSTQSSTKPAQFDEPEISFEEPTQKADPSPNHDDVLSEFEDFDIGSELDSLYNTSNNEPSQDEPTLEFDSLQSTQTPSTTSSFDEVNFGDELDRLSTTTPTKDDSQTPSFELDDFEASFSEPQTQAYDFEQSLDVESQPSNTQSTVQFDNDELFDDKALFDELNELSELESNTEDSVTQFDDTQFEFDGGDFETQLAFDDQSDTAQTHATVNESITEPTFDDTAYEFELDQSSPAVQADVAFESTDESGHSGDATYDDLNLSHDDFSSDDLSSDNFDDFALEETQVVENNQFFEEDQSYEPVASSALDFSEFDTFDDVSEQQPVVAPIAATPVAPAPDVVQEHSFVNAPDNTDVTLQLAEQYINLGEHQSARYLLEEVLTKGNAQEQQSANTLLERIA